MSIIKLLACGGLALGAMLPALSANAQTLTTLYTFQGASDGSNPDAGLTQEGILYGTTPFGGSGGCCGTVFEVDPSSGSESVVHTFVGGSDGASPDAGLTYKNGYLYGTTNNGGTPDYSVGTVFKVNIESGAETVLFRFGPCSGCNGLYPWAGVTFAGGFLYGTAYEGGTNCLPTGCGTVFRVNPTSGKGIVIHDFAFVPDGTNPLAGLVLEKGILYGTTVSGGITTGGAIYTVDPKTLAYAVVESLVQRTGINPVAGLIASHGVLYGTTAAGGSGGCEGGCGTVFAFYPPKPRYHRMLHSFGGAGDGEQPRAALVYQDGNLFGTTKYGGASGYGTVFEVNAKTGAETVLYSFTGGDDGGYPVAELIYYNGAFYGTTESGGSANCGGGCGTVFELTP